MRSVASLGLSLVVVTATFGQQAKLLPALSPPVGSNTPGSRPTVFADAEAANNDEPGQGNKDWFCSDSWCPGGEDGLVRSRLSVRVDLGDGVGYTNGFTYLEGFIPLWQPRETHVAFADLRIVNFDDNSRWEFNGGGGYRMYSLPLDAVLGLNVFYDGRHTDANFFHQIGVGAEVLLPFWEFRCNGYFIAGNQRKLALDSGPVITGIVGNQVIVERLQVFDVAMGGVDAEIGGPLPVLPAHNPRVYVGFYHYSAAGMQSANGIRGRLEAWITPSVSMHFSVQNDAVFDTTVTGGLAFHFGGTPIRQDSGPRTAEERLGQRVVRDVNIVIAQQAVAQEERFTLFADTLAAGAASTPPPSSAPGTPPASSGAATPPPGNRDCVPIVCFPWAPGPRTCRDRDRDDDEDWRGQRCAPGFHHQEFRDHRKYVCFYWPRGWTPPPILRLHGRDYDDRD